VRLCVLCVKEQRALDGAWCHGKILIKVGLFCVLMVVSFVCSCMTLLRVNVGLF